MVYKWPEVSQCWFRAEDSMAARASNETLGFEHVVVVSAGLSWRLEGLYDAAAFTGLKVTVPKQPAWMDAEINVFRRKLTSLSTKNGHVKEEYGIGPGQARCWLGHLNAIKHVIKNQWKTALIMEDDADWDIEIKNQMRLVAPMIQELTNSTSFSDSPYGDSWDILWLGHGGDAIDFEDGRFKLAYDGTLPESTIYRHVYGGRSFYPPQLRAVHYSIAPFCTFAYAVTQAAALKMYALSRGGQEKIITLAMHRWCSQGLLRCVTVNPELFHHHQKAGEIASQIAVAEGWDALSAPPGATYTANILYSARCNIVSL
ncbi:hypothetical protein PWT90_03008 [Aphanocladium album]|nr:hypothetical protein PWT90_03008 [Aphanocladium album]